jgi:DNA-binding transcriptional ArsR family regulator
VSETLDRVFWALSDATRRGIVEQLMPGPASVSTLAGPHDMSLPGFMKHLRVLEEAGIVQREKEGRVVQVSLLAEPMQEAAMWLAEYEKFWGRRFDALGRFLYHQEQVEPWPTPKPRITRASKSSAATKQARKGSGKPGPSRKR